jgi:hypothetical protein
MRWLVAGLVVASGVVAASASQPQAQAAVERPDLYWVRPAGATGQPGPSTQVEVHALDGATTYTKWQTHASTAAQGASTAQWRFLIGDANADDVPDLYALNVAANNNRNTNLHIYDGRTRYQTVLLNQPLPDIGGTSDATKYAFFTGDCDGDGRDDLFLVDARDGQRTAVHVFDAGDRFETFLTHKILAVGGAADFNIWQFAGGDVDGDGRTDVYMINGGNASDGKTSVHIATAASGYLASNVNRVLHGFGSTRADRWRFSVADHDGDGKGDVFGVDSQNDGGRKTSVHVVYAGSGFTTSMNRQTAMGGFSLAMDPTITAWKPTPAKTKPTAVRQKIVKLANDEVGERESRCDRYHERCDAGDLAWCAMFATWTWERVGVTGVPRNMFVARGLGQWGRNKGLFRSTPKVGDWAIYGPPDGRVGGHVDVVVAVHSATEIVVVGGNVSNRVTKRTINPRTARAGSGGFLISGYVSPPGA